MGTQEVNDWTTCPHSSSRPSTPLLTDTKHLDALSSPSAVDFLKEGAVESVEDIDDNLSIGTTASWILNNLDFRTPSSSEIDEEEERERKEEDGLFEREEPEFIFPYPEPSVEVPKYLQRERSLNKTKSGKEKYERGEEVEDAVSEEDGFTAIPEDVDQVALAALVTAFTLGGMWALENGYGKVLLFQ